VSCYHPIKGFRTANGVVFSEKARHGDYLGDIELPCGQCVGCRMRRASDWALRCMHEASQWDDSCFVTLTYASGCLPPNGSLCHADYQKFMKRLRKSIAPEPVRFYMCGEYGDEKARPHYHACLFNVHFRADMVPRGTSASGQVFYDSKTLRELWGHGNVSVQDLTNETASYCTRYIMQKVLGKNAKTAYNKITEDGEIIEMQPPYNAMSLKPGIGAGWFEKYARDVFPHDYVIQNGQKKTPPKYYDKLRARGDDKKADEIEYARQKRALRARPDNTDDRRAVREIVHLAKVRELKRNLK